MKFVLGILAILAGLFYFAPSTFQGLPVPMSESYLKNQISKAAQRCQKDGLTQLTTHWKRPPEVTKAQFESLIKHPKFKESYCVCEAEILSYAGLIPSNFFPKEYREKTIRGLASHLEKHIQTSEGKEQMDYCFFHGWNRAAYAFD